MNAPLHGLVLVVAAAPALLLLGYFYWRDRFDREPLSHVAAAYLLGLYAMIAAQGLAATAEGWVSDSWLHTGGEPARLFDAFVLSGLIEESAKAVLFLGAIYHWDAFDEPLDGLVYGVALALGFATVENYLYIDGLGLQVAWLRGIFAVPAHGLFGAAMGYYAGRSKFERGGSSWRDWTLCLAVPVLFHGGYDYILHHHLTWLTWGTITALSLLLWVFVLRRLRQAQRASPYRPKTMPPPGVGGPWAHPGR